MRIQRPGFSLFEIMVAMSICLLGLTLLLQMTSLAKRYAQRSIELAEEQIICQNVLNEICSGMRGWTPVTQAIYEQNPQYEFSISSEPHAPSGLRLVEVAVRRVESTIASAQQQNPMGAQTSSAQRSSREFRLARLIRIKSADLEATEVIPSNPAEDQRPE